MFPSRNDPATTGRRCRALPRATVLLCSYCHHDLHFGAYTITMDQGIPRITPTTGRAPPLSA
jgi:hypothetical protein